MYLVDSTGTYPISGITGGGGGSYTFSNGLVNNGGIVNLGGSLTANTTILGEGFSLILEDIDFQIKKDDGTSAYYYNAGSDTHDFNGSVYLNNNVYFSGTTFGRLSGSGTTTTNINWLGYPVITYTMSANTTFTFSNLVINKTITLSLSGNSTATFPTYVNFVSGTYDGSQMNYIQFLCLNNVSGSEKVISSILQL
jgi:hypothetical protein